MKRLFKYIVGAALTAIIVYFTITALRGIDWGLVLMHRPIIGTYLLALPVYFASVIFRAFAYSRLIAPEMTDFTAMRVVVTGQALNLLLPLKLGNSLSYRYFPKHYTFRQRLRITITPGVYDALVLVLLVLVTSVFYHYADPEQGRLFLFLGLLALAAMCILLAVARVIPRWRFLVDRYLRDHFVGMFVCIFIAWAAVYLSTAFVLLAYSVPLGQALTCSLGIMCTVNLIGLIPSSPGGVGLYEFAVITGLASLGLDGHLATAIALSSHLVQYITMLPIGIFYYFAGRRKGRRAAA